jgi:hypothetical protein
MGILCNLDFDFKWWRNDLKTTAGANIVGLLGLLFFAKDYNIYGGYYW